MHHRRIDLCSFVEWTFPALVPLRLIRRRHNETPAVAVAICHVTAWHVILPNRTILPPCALHVPTRPLSLSGGSCTCICGPPFKFALPFFFPVPVTGGWLARTCMRVSGTMYTYRVAFLLL